MFIDLCASQYKHLLVYFVSHFRCQNSLQNHLVHFVVPGCGCFLVGGKLKLPTLLAGGKVDYQFLNGLPKIDESTKEYLFDAWSKIVTHGTSAQWNQDNYKEALGHILQGEYFRTFERVADLGLGTILTALKDRYGSIPGLRDYLKQLQNFKRRRGENIKACMYRLLELISLTDTTVPEDERETRKRVYMTDMLFKLVHDRTKAKLEHAQTIASRQSYRLPYNDLLQIAEDEENSAEAAYYDF